MTTYALLFSADVFTRESLEKLNERELYDFANVASNFGYNEADILTLNDFSDKVNNREIFPEYSWLYFVTV